MDERTILKRLARGSGQALEYAISKFSAYVITVIHNRSCGYLTPEDEEEIASDAFFSLWQNADRIRPGHLKSWLGSVAKNKTISRLRSRSITIPIADNDLILDNPQWETLSTKEQSRMVREALDTLKLQDREIFYRYYDLCETTTQIAAAMNIPSSTVRTRLSRGREALRTTLCQGGFHNEDTN